MAKLNGVQTLDMVNGEITKVAYDGTEYVRVGVGFESAQTGDLFQSLGGADTTPGGFYEIKITESGDGHPVTFIDDVGEQDGYERRASHLALFRKVATDSPSLEERVSALESEVSALKGETQAPTITFEGAEYRKVDREAREGDVVIFRENTSCVATNGKTYKAEAEVKGGEGASFIADSHGSFNVYHDGLGRTRETVDVYEPVAKAEPTPSKPKLKAGDFVTVNSVVYTDGFTPGKIYEVHANTSGIFVLDDDGDERRYVLQDGDYEIVDAETAKWAKLGRKVNEYKVGDIIEITKRQGADVVGSIVKVVHVDSARSRVKYRKVNGDGTRLGDFHAIKLIAPVEATQN